MPKKNLAPVGLAVPYREIVRVEDVVKKLPIGQFAKHVLKLDLYPRQEEILEEIVSNNARIAVLALGRRSGKSLLTSVLAIYCGLVLDSVFRCYLRPSEKFYIVSVANSQDQAKIILENIRSMILGSVFKAEIVRETAELIELRNGCVFKCMPASGRSGRGLAIPVLLMDELAFAIDTDGSTGGSAIYKALSPSVAQFGNDGFIVALSSPHIEQGIFYDLYKQAIESNDPKLRAYNEPTWVMNPSISLEYLLSEKERDPEMFNVEFGGKFASNMSALIDSGLIEASIRQDKSKDAYPASKRLFGSYTLCLDPAKGNRDDYVAYLGHYEDGVYRGDMIKKFDATRIIDGKPQVDIEEVERWIMEIHNAYGLAVVVLDQYNSAATIQRLESKINIRELTWTVPSKTAAFSKLRQHFTSGRIEIPNHPKLVSQLKNMTVRYTKNGGWVVSGGAGAAVDDYVFALAGALFVAEDPDEDISWLQLMA